MLLSTQSRREKGVVAIHSVERRMQRLSRVALQAARYGSQPPLQSLTFGPERHFVSLYYHARRYLTPTQRKKLQSCSCLSSSDTGYAEDSLIAS